MAYTASVPVKFCRSRDLVYEALCDLGRYAEWNTDMVYISTGEVMRPGLKYVTRTKVAGRINESHVEVVRLVEGREINLRSSTGMIMFEASFVLADVEGGGTNVTCRLEFAFQNFVIQLARSAIEGMAQDRVRRDLTRLDALLCAEAPAI